MSSVSKPPKHPIDQVDAQLSDLLPDFLNGHLGDDEAMRVKEELAANPELRAQLDQQRQLQTALRAESARNDAMAKTVSSSRGSGFEAIAAKVENSRDTGWQSKFQQWWSGGNLRAFAPLFALVIAVGMFSMTNISSPDIEVNEFETRISPEQFSQPTLRILPHVDTHSPEFSELLSDYDLKLGQRLPDSNIAEVSPLSDHADINGIVRALSDDQRVVFAKVVSGDLSPDSVEGRSPTPSRGGVVE